MVMEFFLQRGKRFGMTIPLLRYGSVCDGMGAAHVASKDLNWQCAWLAEIDPAAAAVTAHHFPDIPNLGDVTAPDFVDRASSFGAIDALVGGTPCQAFSISGLRKGLEDPRGNLTLRFVEIANATGPDGLPVDAVFWENVPGVLSDKTNGFGSLLAGLVGEDTPIPAPRTGWTNAGMVAGPTRTAAWRVLDAQGFVPQRRERVFVVAARHGSWLDPSAVLFETEAEAFGSLGNRAYTGPLFPEREGMRGHPAKGGGAREIVAALTANGVGTCGADDNQAQAGHLVASPIAFEGRNASGPVTVSTTITAHPGGRYDFGSETFIATAVTGDITHALNTANNGKHCGEDGAGRGVPITAQAVSVALRGRQGSGVIEMGDDVAHTLRASQGGGDKPHVLAPVAYRTSPNCGVWETGGRVDALTTFTGSTSHLVVFALNSHAGCADGDQTNRSHANGGPVGMGVSEEVAYTLQSERTQSVAVAFHENQRAEITVNDTAGALKTGGGKPGQGYPAIQQGMAVRRLMPVECLKLQSFPPDYFDNVIFNAKPLADGTRYKLCGNSWNVDTVRWIFCRMNLSWTSRAT
jgi:DNA (cytosine-5)-methyltransferase 1